MIVAGATVVAAMDPASATEVRISRIQNADGFLRGTLEDVAVDPLGSLSLAPRANKITGLEEPFVLSAARSEEGWIVGTGSDGRVLAVDSRGRVEKLMEAPGEQIFAVAVGVGGVIWAGASPSGAIWRLADGKAERFAETGESYIWSLVAGDDGSLWAGTGPRGRLLRIDSQGRSAVMWDGQDPHVRVVRRASGGGVVLGTAGTGLVVRIDADGRAATIFDAAQPEIVDLVVADDGTVWAAAIASEASQVELRPKEKPESEGEGEVTVTVTAEGDGPIGSRPPGFQGARSEVLEIGGRGGATAIASLADQTVLSLVESGGRLWVGTGLEGKVYSIRDRRLVLEHDDDERQVVALLGRPDGPPSLVTTNGGSIVQLEQNGSRSGSFLSPVLDSGQVARFGIARWRGEAPPGTKVTLAVRSGMSAEPDGGWTAWTPAREATELSLTDLPEGRYVQVKVGLEGKDGASPTVAALELSWRQLNQRPKIDAFEAMAPGEVLVPQSFNTGTQVYEAANPTRGGIFTSLTQSPEGGEDARTKTVYKRGFQTYRWKVSDPNGDELRAKLEVRRETGDPRWYTLVEDRAEGYFAFDATVLPDGIWRVRLTVSDARSSAPGEALVTEAVSEPLVLDQTAPSVRITSRTAGRIEVDVVDGLNPLREAVYSVDAQSWTKAAAEDGLVDGRRETLVIDSIPNDAGLVLLRVTDAAFNSTVVDLGGFEP